MKDLFLTIVTVLFLFLMPYVLVNLSKKYKILKTIGVITLCFALGFLVSSLPIDYNRKLCETLSSVLVALSIPLILFSFDLLSVKKLAKSTIVSFVCVIISAIVVSIGVALIGRKFNLPYYDALAGMAMGVYIGGTPNLFAVGKALLGPDSAIINIANILESLFGGIFFFSLVSFVKYLYKKLLPQRDFETDENIDDYSKETEYDYSLLPRDSKGIKRLLAVFGLAVLCLGIGALVEILVNGNMSGSLYIMIIVSLLGVVFSFVKPIRETQGTYQISQYLILVFSLGLSMSVDFSTLASDVLPVFLYFVFTELLITLVHFILCKVFKIDGGTAIVTLVAGLYSPPFVAPIANAYGDKDLIVPGVICGVLGFIIANFIGIGLGTLIVLF